MPIDYTHEHTSRQIMRADNVKTPIDPDASGSAISATDGTTTVAGVTSLRVPKGTLVDGGAGLADVSTASAIYVSDVDPEAVGARNLWLNTAIYPQWFVRNEADDAWETAGPPGWSNANIGLISSPDDTAELALHNDGQGQSVWYAEVISIQASGKVMLLDSGGIHIGAAGPVLLSGTVDPSAGAGIEATVGSVFLRYASGATIGEFWLKTGGGDTAWNMLLADNANAPGSIGITAGVGLNLAGSIEIQMTTPSLLLNGDPFGPASHVGDGATVDDLRDALIASGLMAAS